MSSKPLIEAENLGKVFHIYDRPDLRLRQFLLGWRKQYYREFWALRGIGFEIGRGETIGFMGRNGAGKSTLLQLVCGTLTPSEGQVIVRGRISALLELGSGFNPEFSGHDNVYLYGSLLGLSVAEIDARYDRILTFAEIGQFIDLPVKTYSSGMLVRLAFSVAINIDPEILVVDEALAVGDARFTARCMTQLRKLQDTGVSILSWVMTWRRSLDFAPAPTSCTTAVWCTRDRPAKRSAGTWLSPRPTSIRGECRRSTRPAPQTRLIRWLTNTLAPRRMEPQPPESELPTACPILCPGATTCRNSSCSAMGMARPVFCRVWCATNRGVLPPVSRSDAR